VYHKVRYLDTPKISAYVVNEITFLDLIVSVFFFQQIGTPGGFSITNQDCTTKVSTYLKIGCALCYIMFVLKIWDFFLLLLYDVLCSQYCTVIEYIRIASWLVGSYCFYVGSRSSRRVSQFSSVSPFTWWNDALKQKTASVLFLPVSSFTSLLSFYTI
jgi:hypothetical protein